MSGLKPLLAAGITGSVLIHAAAIITVIYLSGGNWGGSNPSPEFVSFVVGSSGSAGENGKAPATSGPTVDDRRAEFNLDSKAAPKDQMEVIKRPAASGRPVSGSHKSGREGVPAADGMGIGDPSDSTFGTSDSGTGAGAPLVLLSGPPPRYPAAARRAAFEGRTVLLLAINPNGTVNSADIEETSGRKDCDESARSTILSRWRFAAREQPVQQKIAIRFALK